MTAILEWAVNLSLKALAIAFAWIPIRFVMRVGKTTFKTYLETAALYLQARGIIFRRKVLKQYADLAEQTAAPEEKDNGCKVEATIR